MGQNVSRNSTTNLTGKDSLDRCKASLEEIAPADSMSVCTKKLTKTLECFNDLQRNEKTGSLQCALNLVPEIGLGGLGNVDKKEMKGDSPEYVVKLMHDTDKPFEASDVAKMVCSFAHVDQDGTVVRQKAIDLNAFGKCAVTNAASGKSACLFPEDAGNPQFVMFGDIAESGGYRRPGDKEKGPRYVNRLYQKGEACHEQFKKVVNYDHKYDTGSNVVSGPSGGNESETEDGSL